MAILVLDISNQVGITSTVHICVSVGWEVEDASLGFAYPAGERPIPKISIGRRLVNLYSEHIMPFGLCSGFPLEPSAVSVLVGESLLSSSNFVVVWVLCRLSGDLSFN